MAKHDGQDSTVSMTKSELMDLISTSISTALKTVAEINRAKTTDEKREEIYRKPRPEHTLHVAESEETVMMNPVTGDVICPGAAFDLRVDHRGIVVGMLNYVHPENIPMPEGMGGYLTNKDGTDTMAYKHWKWVTYWQRDLQHYVGKRAPSHKGVTRVEPIAEATDQAAE